MSDIRNKQTLVLLERKNILFYQEILSLYGITLEKELGVTNVSFSESFVDVVNE